MGRAVTGMAGGRCRPRGRARPSTGLGHRRAMPTPPTGPAAARPVISQKLSPRGFSKPFHHPEGRRLFSIYDILRTPIKTFSRGARFPAARRGAAGAVEAPGATLSSRTISGYPPSGPFFEGRRLPLPPGAWAARRLGPSMTI